MNHWWEGLYSDFSLSKGTRFFWAVSCWMVRNAGRWYLGFAGCFAGGFAFALSNVIKVFFSIPFSHFPLYTLPSCQYIYPYPCR